MAAGVQINYIPIEVEFTIISASGGIPAMFHPDNPFIRRNDYQPLPFFNYYDKSARGNGYNVEIHWIVEEELTITPPSINLKKTFNCFDQVASQGAKYSIRLCVDVPDNDSPTRLPALSNSEIGHSFVVVTKSNDSRSVTQVFGFYAVKHPGYFDPFRDMPSVIKNNQLREINASIEMSLTAEQFDLLRKKAYELARHKYAATDYNCTNFGLDLFNAVRGKNPITIEPYIIYLPSASYSSLIPAEPNILTIEKTPQKLFKKLKEMKDHGDKEASSIVIDQTHNTFAPISHGPCD